jgi:predicted MPP superfamily phosphohydrolase
MMVEWVQNFSWQPVIGWLAGLLLGSGLFLFSFSSLLSRLTSRRQRSFLLPILLLVSLALFGWLGWWSTSKLGWISPIILIGCLGIARNYTWRQELKAQAEPAYKTEGPKRSIWRPVTTWDLQTLYYKVELEKKLPFPVRIVQISDLHVNQRLGMDYYHQALKEVADLQADILVSTGDYVSDSSNIGLLKNLLQNLPARLGRFAVLGNHDYWADEVEITWALEATGFRVLSRHSARVALDDKTAFVISGCEMPWSKTPCRITSPGAGEISLVLSHSADPILALNQLGADLVFTGHYHAGQIQLPWVGPLVVPSIFGRRFYHGHFLVDKTHLFVSAGVGASTPAVRLYCPPDILVVDLYS